MMPTVKYPVPDAQERRQAAALLRRWGYYVQEEGDRLAVTGTTFLDALRGIQYALLAVRAHKPDNNNNN